MQQKNIIAALLKVQAEIKKPAKTGENPRFRSTYAKLEDIYSACQDALTKHEVLITHTVIQRDGKYFLQTMAIHSSGETMISEFPMILENQTNQSIASARTYACRYSLCNLLAINLDKDDDGNAANDADQQKQTIHGEAKLTAFQIQDLLKRLQRYPHILKRILESNKIASLEDLSPTQYQSALNIVQYQEKQHGGAA